MKLRTKLMLALLLGAVVFCLGRCDKNVSPVKQSLPVQDKEVVSYDETQHRVLITTAKGTVSQYSRNPTIEVLKSGETIVQTHSWGVERHPFWGAGYSDAARIVIGVQVFYVRQFDVGLGVALSPTPGRVVLRPVVPLGYNFYGNTSINVGINPFDISNVGVFLTTRF